MARKVALALLALAALARADGAVVSTKAPVVRTPCQQAILVWKDGRERLVIDTAHTGEGDLAWIVPLPAPPRIEPVSPAVFRTLEAVTMPAPRDGPSKAWQPGLCLLIAIALLSVSRSNVASLSAGLLLPLGLFLLVIPSIPETTQSPGSTVTVLGRSRAGNYDTATVAAVEAGALLSWLREGGFETPPEIRTGIEGYVRDGWTFAVARLKSGGAGGRAHPLSFEFDANEAVYPMRLTATQSQPVSLRLFVLSDRRASCDALSVESCYKTRASGPPYGQDEVRQIGQPELLRIADGATVLTTLVGDPGPSQGDLRIEFEDYAPRTPVVYSEDAARSGAAGTAVWVAVALLLAGQLAKAKGWSRILAGRRGRIVAWCVAIDIGLVAGVADYVTTDIGEIRITFGIWISHSHARNHVAAAADIAAARAEAAAAWLGKTNPYDGLAVREEPSPGNYGFEMRAGKLAYVPYDSRGAPMGPDDW